MPAIKRETDLIKEVKTCVKLVNHTLSTHYDFVHGGEREGTSKHLLCDSKTTFMVEGTARELLLWCEGALFGDLQIREIYRSKAEKANQEFADKIRKILEDKAAISAKLKSLTEELEELSDEETQRKADTMMVLQRLNKAFNPDVTYFWKISRQHWSGEHINLFRQSRNGETKQLASCKTWSAANGFLRGFISAADVPELM